MSLRRFAIVCGVTVAAAMAILGPALGLQLFADGAAFSYGIAIENAWGLHFDNIAVRVAVYLYEVLPAELLVSVSGDAIWGVRLYGVLHYLAPLGGLALTYRLDRSRGRIFFAFACASTALLCPFVFGFPSEMWLTQAIFWPTIASAHDGREGVGALPLRIVLFIVLALTHEGGVVFAVAILATVLMVDGKAERWHQTGIPLALALAVWGAIKVALPPDAYFAGVVGDAALNFIDVGVLAGIPVVVLVATALTAFMAAGLAAGRLGFARPELVAAGVTGLALAVYWLAFDTSLHGDTRYAVRTIVFVATPVFGALAAFNVKREAFVLQRLSVAKRLVDSLAREGSRPFLIGAMAMVLLVHGVETAKFAVAWQAYKQEVIEVSKGTVKDASNGEDNLVPYTRISERLAPLVWWSTTQFQSVLMTPGLAPRSIIVEPSQDNYIWLSCADAAALEATESAVPLSSRRLLRIHACKYRP